MKKTNNMRRAILKNLIVGLLVPFVIILLFISLQIYKDVETDKEDAYLDMIQMMSDNMNEMIHQYVAVVEVAADNEKVTSMDADVAEKYLNEIITESRDVWSHFLITDSEGTEIAHTRFGNWQKSLRRRQIIFRISVQW